jgi:hypothetical protein
VAYVAARNLALPGGQQLDMAREVDNRYDKDDTKMVDDTMRIPISGLRRRELWLAFSSVLSSELILVLLRAVVVSSLLSSREDASLLFQFEDL